MFYCNVEKCIKNSVKCPLSSECSSWYIRILALLISPNNECDLVISRFVCPPRPAAWIPPAASTHPTPPPPIPHTQVYWLNVMRSLQASSVNVFIWQTESPAPSLDLHPKRHLTKISSMAQSADGKSIRIVTGPVGKHVDYFPQSSSPREKKTEHMHTPSITVIQSSVNVPTMPLLLSKIHLVDQCCSPKCLFYRRLNVPTKEQKQSTERVKEIFGRGMVLIRWVAMLCTRQGSTLGLVTAACSWK